MAKTRSTKAKKKTKSVQLVAKTVGELSRHYGVTSQMIRGSWLLDPSFPGRSGDGGRRSGRFPIEKIDRWLIEKDSQRTVGPPSKAVLRAAERLGVKVDQAGSSRSKKIDVELELAEIKRDEKRGRLVDRDVVRAEILRQHGILMQSIRQLPHMLRDVLPVDLAAEIKADFFRRAEIQVQKACDSFLEGLEGV